MEKIFKVSEFNEFINIYLNKVGEVVVEGEISQINISQGKWLFLTIKDKDSSVEVFSVLNTISNYDLLEEGMLVHIYGIPRLYQKTGRFSISAYQILPAGEGSLKIAFEKLKLKLEEEGLFSEARKRPLPLFPQQIGLITAKNSQAYHDFIKVLTARMGGIKIYFYPVSVQGKGSVTGIVKAFEYFNSSKLNLDLIAVVRGGGSLEDLQSFNTQEVARAIYASKFPVVCGVGHEKDISISDMVCDLRASTPSNAAELIVEQKEYALTKVAGNFDYLYNYLNSLVLEKRNFVLRCVSTLELTLSLKIRGIATLTHLFRSQFYNFEVLVKNRFSQTEQLTRFLKSLDYKNVLKRGFSITYNEFGKVVKFAKDAPPKTEVTTTLFDGKIVSVVR